MHSLWRNLSIYLNHSLLDRRISVWSTSLYQSIFKLSNLTVFELKNLQFKHHINVLLEFLQSNCSLKCVKLTIKFLGSNHHKSLHNGQIDNDQFRYLVLTCNETDITGALHQQVVESLLSLMIRTCPGQGVERRYNFLVWALRGNYNGL